MQYNIVTTIATSSNDIDWVLCHHFSFTLNPANRKINNVLSFPNETRDLLGTESGDVSARKRHLDTGSATHIECKKITAIRYLASHLNIATDERRINIGFLKID